MPKPKKSEPTAAPEAAPAAALDTGRMHQVRFDQLAVSPLNVRKDATVGPDDELVASIRSHGLLQPLVGYIAKSGPAIVLVCAGQRRLLALAHIVTPETEIPVRIVDEATAIEVSLAENLARKDMNPADELAAFQALVDTGAYDGNRIADRFGYDRRYVRRRLKMAVLHPEIMDALRAGTIGISSAEAYAASDDQDLQLQVFKEQSRPNCWNAHAPDTIVRGYACAGIAALSAVGKFIGGAEAYEAAGGSCAEDDAFSELLASASAYSGPRLKDATIVRQLLERAQAEAQPQVEAQAKEKYPFASSVDWCDANGNAPKPPKGSDLVLLQLGWDAATGEHRTEKDVDDLADKAAAAGGTVVALARVSHDGTPTIVNGQVLVTKSALEKVTPKKSVAPRSSSGMSAVEQEAWQRSRDVQEQMKLKYGRSLIGETPGFGVTSVSYSRYDSRLCIQLKRLEKGGDDIDAADEWTPEIRADLLEPFRQAAEEKVDELYAAKAAEAAAQQEENAAAQAKLAELEQLAIAEWPAVVVVTTNVDVGDATLIITRIEEGGEPALNLVDSIEDPSIAHDAAFTAEVIRDQIAELSATIRTYDTVEAFAADHDGRCRMCGCTEAEACCGADSDEEWSGPCGWADATRTLCDNPDCLAKAGVTVAEEADA